MISRPLSERHSEPTVPKNNVDNQIVPHLSILADADQYTNRVYV